MINAIVSETDLQYLDSSVKHIFKLFLELIPTIDRRKEDI